MINIVTLDVLVVYSSDTAISASVEDSQSTHPFLIDSKQANYNLSYSYFLDACRKKGLKAGFTTSSDIIGPGMCESYWKFESGKWNKVNALAHSIHIFDKVSSSSSSRKKERQLLLSGKNIQPFSDVELFKIFSDKQYTYQKLSSFSIPTVSLRSAKAIDIKNAVRKLRTVIRSHPYATDFSKQIVLKDRFGAGGNHVYKIDNNCVQNIKKIMSETPKTRFIIQPFLPFDKGYVYKNRLVSTDIRLIIHNNSLLQCYIRMAKGTEFRCNEHQGGQLEYVAQRDIPQSIHLMSQKIIKKLNKPRALFALDFVISNTGRPYFLEGNIYPGLDWDVNKKINEKKSKELIRCIVSSIVDNVHKTKPRSVVLFYPKYSITPSQF